MGEEKREGVKRCLKLAESIIFSLEDEEVIAEYRKERERLLSSRRSPSAVPPERAYSLYQTFLDENHRLRAEYAELAAKHPNFSGDPALEMVNSRLQQLQKAILATYELKKAVDPVEELRSLKRIVEVKVDALNHVRDTLKNEQERLQRDLKSVRTETQAQLSKAQEREDNERLKMDTERTQLVKEMEQAEKELQAAQSKYELAVDENEGLKQRHSDTLSLMEKLSQEINQNRTETEQMESECETLLVKIADTKTQITIRTKELAALQSLQKYGIHAESELSIEDEIERLKQKADELRTENAQISFELKRLKRKKKAEPSLDISLDEDDLAAQMLRSNFR